MAHPISLANRSLSPGKSQQIIWLTALDSQVVSPVTAPPPTMPVSTLKTFLSFSHLDGKRFILAKMNGTFGGSML